MKNIVATIFACALCISCSKVNYDKDGPITGAGIDADDICQAWNVDLEVSWNNVNNEPETLVLNSEAKGSISYRINHSNGLYHEVPNNGCGIAPTKINSQATYMRFINKTSSITSCEVKNDLDDADWVPCKSGWIEPINNGASFRLNDDSVQIRSVTDEEHTSGAYPDWVTCVYTSNERMILGDPQLGNGNFQIRLHDSNGCTVQREFDFTWASDSL